MKIISNKNLKNCTGIILAIFKILFKLTIDQQL